jgi:hypothetical protein
MASERGQKLLVLYEMCRDPDLEDDLAFTEVFTQTMDELELTVRDTADGLRVSLPTVRRWRLCRNLPRRVMRRQVYAYFRKKLRAAGMAEDEQSRLA